MLVKEPPLPPLSICVRHIKNRRSEFERKICVFKDLRAGCISGSLTESFTARHVCNVLFSPLSVSRCEGDFIG